MPLPVGWIASTAVASRPIIPWSGHVWRGHTSWFSPLSHEGSLFFSGRFNRGRDLKLPDNEIWPAHYLTPDRDAVLGELNRHFVSSIPKHLQEQLNVNPEMSAADVIEQVRKLLSELDSRNISEIALDLSAVMDCRDVRAMGLKPPLEKPEDLFHDTDYSVGQELAAAVIARGAEAMLIPSAAGGHSNSLIIFPNSLRPDSKVELIETVAHHFYVDRL